MNGLGLFEWFTALRPNKPWRRYRLRAHDLTGQHRPCMYPTVLAESWQQACGGVRREYAEARGLDLADVDTEELSAE